ncbi:MAG TPA: DUF2127 domain-containing protein [Candidatus Paceibacterota bacterium]|nr:DUF2127 domain-containing protein [Candidatus Paceibacterota bacterium]
MNEKKLRVIFVASLCLKALGAALQIGLGSLLLVTGRVSSLIAAAAANELIEDPNDFFARHAASALSHFSPHLQYVGAAYLLLHGAAKVVLIWALIKEKLWAYPASLALFSLFIVYQLVHATWGSLFPLAAFAAFEVFLLWLIWHEYHYVLRKRGLPIE